MCLDLIENEELFIVLDINREKTDEIEKYQVDLNHIKNIICHLVTRNIINNIVWCDLHISDYWTTGYAFTNFLRVSVSFLTITFVFSLSMVRQEKLTHL